MMCIFCSGVTTFLRQTVEIGHGYASHAEGLYVAITHIIKVDKDYI